jgi:acyl carrier protein
MLPMENIVFQVISQVLEVPLNEITLESSSDTIESWDSLKHMNLILALEDEFDIQFSDDQIVKMLNVGLILEAIKEAKAL